MPPRITNPRGIIQSGVVVVLFGSDSGNFGAEIQRSSDWGGAPLGDWETVGFMDRVEDGGSPFFDLLPLDSRTRWYRSRHVSAGHAQGPWYEPVEAIPEIIPPIDWQSKPWMMANLIPLRLSMDIVSETTSSLHVTASINDDPASLANPIVSVYSYTGIPNPPTPTGSYGWVVEKPDVGFGRVVFTNTVPGRIGGLDSIDIVSALTQLDPDEFLVLKLTTIANDASIARISASVQNPLAVPFGINVFDYSNIGSLTPVSTHVWDVGKPASGTGTITFHVSSSTPGIVGDFDTVYLEKDLLHSLNVQSQVVSTDLDSVTTDTLVRDPLTTTGFITGLTMTPTFIAQTGVSVSLTSIVSSSGFTTYRHRTTRPFIGQGT